MFLYYFYKYRTNCLDALLKYNIPNQCYNPYDFHPFSCAKGLVFTFLLYRVYCILYNTVLVFLYTFTKTPSLIYVVTTQKSFTFCKKYLKKETSASPLGFILRISATQYTHDRAFYVCKNHKCPPHGTQAQNALYLSSHHPMPLSLSEFYSYSQAF